MLLIIKLFVPTLPTLLPVALFVLCMVIAFVEQLAIRKIALKSENEVFDKMFCANGSADWQSNAVNMVNEKIKEQSNIDSSEE